MKKLFFWALMAFCAYKFYQYLGAPGSIGATEQGGKMTRLFVGPGCGAPCDEVKEILTSRKVSFEIIDVSTPEGEGYGINQYPLTVVGKRKVLGNNRHALIGALVETYGNEALTAAERAAMAGHFDADGRPRVVLYGTSWCPYCKQQREYFSQHGVAYVNIDVEASAAGKAAYDTLQSNGYPLVYVGYQRFDGYREQEILDAIAESQ